MRKNVCFQLNFPKLPHYLLILITAFISNRKPVDTWGPAKWNPISKMEALGKIPMRWYRIDSSPSITEFPHTKRMNFWDEIWKDHIIPALQRRDGGSRSPHVEL